MDLPSKEKTFDFEHVGQTTDKKYDGRFTVRCVLNVGQKHALALEKTRLMGSYENPSDELVGLAIVLATLRARIVDAPEWWKQSQSGSLIDDEDALVYLFQKIQEAESEWKEELKKKTQKTSDQSQ